MPRHVCTACGHIHYQNPRIVVGTLPLWGDKILFCKRAIEPKFGLWTLPAGFMENGESLEQGALRETSEEAGVPIELSHLYSLISLPYVNQVHIFFLADIKELKYDPGIETSEIKLCALSEIPWEMIAFRTVGLTLKHWVENQKMHIPYMNSLGPPQVHLD